MTSTARDKRSFATEISVLRDDAGADAHKEALLAIYEKLDVDDDRNRSTLVEEGLVAALVKALERSYNKTTYFVYFAYKILAILPGSFDDDPSLRSPANATAIVNSGGLQHVLDFLDSSNEDEIVDTFYAYHGLCVIFAVQVALKEDKGLSLAVAKLVMPVLVTLMETHGLDAEEHKSCDLFVSGCEMFMICARAMEGLVESAHAERMVQSAWSGITYHKNDSEVQEAGRDLLTRLVGPETALEMIDHAEMHHCEDAECSCAA
ncbi:expressed unknown protein [Seminavis robusta]|uniref:Uncharacterized protein n=1 Tax=Seminavis robusta TaxID=568900 RepID=A0A9N8DV06_9STRA|nr:expressed unknown protein [Seminavis robusta]|eukprot:Sro372_g128790.1 n/a (263) ;mRNA; f:31890-32678